MAEDAPYIMSFSIGGLNLRESLIVTNAYLSSNDWDQARTLVIQENLLQSRMISSAKRLLSELIPRLQLFSERELHLFRTSPDQDQRHLLWLAICRRHAFIADFYTQVVHDRYLSLKETVGNDEFNIFWNQKEREHPELERISVLTREKLRTVVFKMMREVGLITKNNHINTVLLSPLVQNSILMNAPQELSWFTTIDDKGRRI
ncbi:MAG: DUF1819 family protein [Sphaerochaeta sp.]|jgi:hypothetical protein|uniref:DUF1819 family protein n=1 Tax=Sphaerochaeta sp. TaxID=1972642 RepID=UPI002A361D07|nr:DUF1819 family protein [Sphaerochaeta sp.]MCK9601812.1 DUF1819 family protein [Sphaerochaeta sp.]MDX9825997.1 DUF1819 family protein [Sphaerochaeta sp.]